MSFEDECPAAKEIATRLDETIVQVSTRLAWVATDPPKRNRLHWVDGSLACSLKPWR